MRRRGRGWQWRELDTYMPLVFLQVFLFYWHGLTEQHVVQVLNRISLKLKNLLPGPNPWLHHLSLVDAYA